MVEIRLRSRSRKGEQEGASRPPTSTLDERNATFPNLHRPQNRLTRTKRSSTPLIGSKIQFQAFYTDSLVANAISIGEWRVSKLNIHASRELTTNHHPPVPFRLSRVRVRSRLADDDRRSLSTMISLRNFTWVYRHRRCSIDRRILIWLEYPLRAGLTARAPGKREIILCLHTLTPA